MQEDKLLLFGMDLLMDFSTFDMNGLFKLKTTDMKTLNLDENFQVLTDEELLVIDGGCAYDVGHTIGKIVAGALIMYALRSLR